MGESGNAFQWTRRGVVAAVVVALSLAGHAAGNPMLPNATGLTIAVAVAMAVTVGVRSGASRMRLFGILLAAQALLHVVFVLSSDCSMGSMSVIPSPTSVVGHVVASVVAVAVLRHGDQLLIGWTALLTAVFGAPVLALPQIAGRPVLPAPVWDARTHGADVHLSTQVRRGPPAI